MKKVIFVLLPLLLITACEENNPTISDDSLNVTVNNYGSGMVCGGAVVTLNNKVYRSFEGGLASLDDMLNINESDKIGNFDQSQVYHIEVIEDEVWFSLTNYTSFNEIKVLDFSGNITASYEAGIMPGDFAKWSNNGHSWVFVANEGNLGSSNGSISMIDQDGNISHTESIGDVVQAIEVYGDKLIALVNNSHKIIVYSITEDGLAMPGIEVSTNESGPRDLVIVDDMAYFTNFVSQDVKVFNLFNYTFEPSISVDGLPEDIDYDGQYLWVTVPHSDLNFNTGNTVSKIDINTNSIVETFEVGDGPQNLVFLNDDVYISRTYYDESFNAFHGSSRIQY